MKALYELKEHSQAELKVTVDGENWSNATEKAFKKIAKNVELKGFRKGKAPESLVRKAVNQQEIFYEAIDLVAQEALEFGLKEYPDIRLVDRPALDVEAVDSESVGLVFKLTVYPTVTLGDYKAVEYKEERVSVLKKDVDREIENMRTEHAEEVLKEEGTVENGNIAVIDFEGFKDGVAFDGGKGTEFPLEIGSGSFIPGFEEQLIGMAEGEEKDINVTFPENYGAAELAGQPVVFHVKVDGIKEKKLPELNDEFVEELNLAEDVKTVDQLTKHIKEQMTAQRKQEAEDKATNQLLDDLCDKATVDIPQVMIDEEVENLYNSYKSRIQQQGISWETYLRIMSTDETTFKNQVAPDAEKRVKIRLVLEAIAKDMGIVATEEDIAEEYRAMATQYKLEVEKIKELVPESYLAEDVANRKALEEIKKNAKPAKKSKPAAETEDEEKKPAKKKSTKKTEE